jgi:uncharacterized protein YbbC (DUF1343 family)
MPVRSADGWSRGPLESGLDKLLAEPSLLLKGRRFGLLLNQASLDADGRYACDRLDAVYPGQLQCLFSPQHGIWGEEQANMIETGHATYQPLSVPLFSLYSETRQPTPEMLADIDLLLIDLQDVGTRVYTFIWTMLNCLTACARAGVSVLVLDRPNPLGGLQVEGRRLHSDYRSFVGLAEIPMRHGLTIGELARCFAQWQNIDVDLHIMAMQGWRRQDRYPASQRKWVLPSPNMPSYSTACVYPGCVLLEGTNLSEGRGTTIPFEVVGAPFIDGIRLAQELSQRQLPGVRFRPTRFRPTFDKWQGSSCSGVAIDILDEYSFAAYRSYLHLLHAVRWLYPEEFVWLPPPYEYETIQMPIDILSGSHQVRCAIDRGCDWEDLDALATTEPDWWPSVEPYLLY